MNIENISKILDSYQLIDRLKQEVRHSWISNDRRESVPEHTWGMALLACMIAPHLKFAVSLDRVVRMIIIHDLAEAETGDIPIFEESARQRSKFELESQAVDKIKARLPEPFASEFVALWHEFEKGDSNEAKFARALDRLEVQLQHNRSDFTRWEPIEYELVYSKMRPVCKYDEFLDRFCTAVETEAEELMQRHNVNFLPIRERVRNG